MEIKTIELIKSLTHAFRPAKTRVSLPIGDDMAGIYQQNHGLLLAADMLLDGVHFDAVSTPPELIGRKALAVNLSDVAAMAGTPLACTVSLAIPKETPQEWTKLVMTGLCEIAQEYSMELVGGDTNVWHGPFVIDVAILGAEHSKGSVKRSGAKPGDSIYVTGPLGGSLSGRHLTFTPRVQEAQWLREHFNITSMIDLSDGLGKDLRHILAASEVGAVVTSNSIPRNKLANGESCSMEQAFCDGEDFELCFTISRHEVHALTAEAQKAGFNLYRLGEITAEKKLKFDDGSLITFHGYEHG